jgi:hypothetical protein
MLLLCVMIGNLCCACSSNEIVAHIDLMNCYFMLILEISNVVQYVLMHKNEYCVFLHVIIFLLYSLELSACIEDEMRI